MRFVENGFIYVVEGFTNGARSAIVQLYNPATDTWTSAGPLLVAKSDSVLGLLGTTIISASGLENSGNPSGDNEGYQAATNTWSELTADPIPRNAGCGSGGGRPALLSRKSTAGQFGNATTVTESYNFSKNAMTTLAASAAGRDHRDTGSSEQPAILLRRHR